MRTITVRELQQGVRACVDAAQRDRVVVTRHGRPAAILYGVEGEDWETVALETDGAFWRLVEKRRKERTIPLAEMRKRILPKQKNRR